MTDGTFTTDGAKSGSTESESEGFSSRLVPVRNQLAKSSRPSLWVRRFFRVLFGLPKTVYFNLRVLPFRQAVRLPLLVSPKVALYDLRGAVTIQGPIRPAMILIGFGELGAFDFRRSRAVWQVAGRVVFEGPARLGHGFKLTVADTGTVTFGSEFLGIIESQVLCRDSIRFGRGSAVGWNVMITDTDFHELIPAEGPPADPNAPVVIGDGAWIGARSTIMKGVRVPHDTVVAAGSVVARPIEEANTVVAGNPAKTVRTGVKGWRYYS
jgi:acetyltransferase-like isoleucine patch superfamily enzyme